VDVEIDGARVDSLVHIGKSGTHPVGIPFDLGISEGVFGRGMMQFGEETGCWVWLDGDGWHVRMDDEGSSHTYTCRVWVSGELLGASGVGIEAGDSVKVVGGEVEFGGHLGVGDYEDGMDLVAGDSLSVTVFTASQNYGNVGSSEVMKYYDVWFLGGGIGDGVGVWFEQAMSSGGGNWKDWLRVLVLDGEVVLERVVVGDVGGGVKSVKCGMRNAGGGGLRNLQGKLRGLSGVEVVDSMSAYGNLASGGYGEGDGYEVVELGGAVRYQVKAWDAYGRVWKDTVDVREVGVVGTVEYEVGSDNVELIWGRSGDSMLAGYDIYRGDERGGSYSLVGRAEGYSRYVDGGLGSEESYYYYIRARDAMGNLSASSETVEAWTGAPELPGWPVSTGNIVSSSVAVADFDHDGYLEVVVGSRDESVYMWRHDGTLAPGWPRRTGDIIFGSPAGADLDGDGKLEVVIGSKDGYLYAYNHDGSGLLSPNGIFKHPTGYLMGAPAIDDLDGDKDFEIVVVNDMGQVYIWHHDGTGWGDPTGYFANTGYGVQNGPTIADLDGDGELEIIVTSAGTGIFAWNLDGTGMTQPSGQFASMTTSGSAAVGDLDNNGSLELVAGSAYGTQMAAYYRNGVFFSGWPQVVDNLVYCGPALANLDGDGKLDVVVGTFRRAGVESASVYVFSDNGVVRPGWPKRVKGDFNGTPVVGDMDGDGQADIVAGSTDGRIYAWHKDGTSVKGWPRNFVYEFYSTPAICDLDKDGRVDLVVSGNDGRVHAFDISTPYNKGTMEWPKIHHDLYNSNLYRGPSRSDVPPVRPEHIPLKLAISCYPSPSMGSLHMRLGVPSAQSVERVLVEVFDVRGRLVKHVADKMLEPGYHDIEWNGTDSGGERVTSGIYFVRVLRKGEGLSQKVVLVR
jgi:hypothetical protein